MVACRWIAVVLESGAAFASGVFVLIRLPGTSVFSKSGALLALLELLTSPWRGLRRGRPSAWPEPEKAVKLDPDLPGSPEGLCPGLF